ncbi:GbsR/MarR family transcriptional regulator [Streptomyces nigrescens]
MSEQPQQSADRTDDTRQDSGDIKRDDEAVSQFVERFASQLVEAGMQRMSARVFACLLASDSGVLTSAELGERLQVSPAAVSGAIRYLSQVDMVSREREPGSRRDRYRVHSDQWYEAMTRRDNMLTRWESTLREGVAGLGETTPAGRRLGETLAFFEFMQKELGGMLERWRNHRDELRTDHESQTGTPGAPLTRSAAAAAARPPAAPSTYGS